MPNPRRYGPGVLGSIEFCEDLGLVAKLDADAVIDDGDTHLRPRFAMESRRFNQGGETDRRSQGWYRSRKTAAGSIVAH